MRVLITREDEAAQPYDEAVRDLGGEAIIQPLYHYHDVDASLRGLSRYKALVFTSAYAIKRFAGLSPERALPVYVVGPQSAQEAHQCEFKTVHTANGTGADLVPLLTAGGGPYLYLRGRDVSLDLAKTVPAMDEIILYETVPVVDFHWPEEVDCVLFFSARAARIFTQLAENKGFSGGLSRTKALCLGAGMVEFLSPLRWLDVRIAATPDRAGMVGLLKKEQDRQDGYDE